MRAHGLRKAMSAAVLMAIGAAAIGAAAVGAQELPVRNGGFEEGELSAAHWRSGADIPGVEYIWDRDVGHESASSLSIRKTANRFFPIAQWTQTLDHVEGRRKLRMSAQVKARDMRKAILDVAFLDADGAWSHQWAVYIGEKKRGDKPANHDWKKLSGVVGVPEGTEKIVLGLQVYGPGQVWFDGVEARYVADETPPSLYNEDGSPRR